jgi:hypothetical protein
MKTKSIDRHLAAMWSPPEKLPNEKSAGQPLICVASTYTFNANFLESDLLPRFLGLRFDDTEGNRPFIVEREDALRCCRVSLLVDASNADSSQTTLRWDQIPVFVPGGVQHAKVTLLMWESCARLIVASANVTRSGYRKNREIAGALDFFNHGDSTPRKVLYDAIDFLQGIVFWSRADSTVLDRLRNGLQDARDRVGYWSQAPKEFTERERPQVFFVPGYPQRDGAASSSVLKKTVELWGNSSASEVTVLTPFLGQPDSDYLKLIDALRLVPLAREATSYLALPRRCEIDDDDKIPRIGLPGRFRDEWAKAWGIDPGELELYGIPPLRKGTDEKVLRDLHAKAILIANDAKTMLLCGSSNFSAHGMGIGAFNIEANLVYSDSTTDFLGKIALEDRLPVDWDLDKVIDAVWDDEGVNFGEDEEPKEPCLPSVFQWATFRQTDAIVTIGFKAGATFPLRWEIKIPGEKQEKGLAILNGNVFAGIAPERYDVNLPDHLKKVHLTNLRVIWYDDKNIERTARLLVHVLKQEDLLPPPEFVGMSVNGIVDCLIAGKELSDITTEKDDATSTPPEPRNPMPKQDTSDYLLYRIRRLGYALGVLGDRVLKAARTEDAITYRLMHDPLGPVQLADALIREHEGRAHAEGEVEAVMFALCEIMLVVAHAAARCFANREGGEPDLREKCFVACINVLKQKVESIKEKSRVDGEVLEYAKQVLKKSNKLLG